MPTTNNNEAIYEIALEDITNGNVQIIVAETKTLIAEIGRGGTDTDIGYIALPNASGTKCYVYPDAAGTAITVSTTKP